ncbi:MAG: class I SAM-dependent methyltransferase [Candidatus Gracilibacteria bacterium]|nr:class I SAM-dependent methyltransferase [Candidatus Gracilibacteria bacterium]
MVNYNNFAKTFSQSRKNMKWEEMEYFLKNIPFNENTKILDIGSGNGRFLGELLDSAKTGNFPKTANDNYLGIDLSSGLLTEAKKLFPGYLFLELNMIDIDSLEEKYTDIFLYASFHHLKSISDRFDVLQKAYELLETGGRIYLTNWALDSQLNKKRYSEAQIPNSVNEYGSTDFNIKLGGHDRYYHCFSIDELQCLFKETGFTIIENRLFENDRNIISIIEK